MDSLSFLILIISLIVSYNKNKLFNLIMLFS